MIKKIGVLTSGGDAPGMNAAIRGVARYATYKGLAVEGILRGYDGLIYGESMPLNRRNVGAIIHRGGTMLRTARSKEFMSEQGRRKALEFLEGNHIDALIVIGGDGSMRGAIELWKLGFPVVVIPGTIDNDMPGTQYTLGFDTSVNTVLVAVNKIRDSAFSHDRVALVEVMGRHAGYIALEAGLACGAEMVVIPEKNLSKELIVHNLVESHKQWKNNSIVVIAEGAMSGSELCDYIKETHPELSPNLTVLGYLQRGGAPTAYDAKMACLFSQKAVETLIDGKENGVVGLIDNKVTLTPFEDIDKVKFSIDENEYDLVQAMGK